MIRTRALAAVLLGGALACSSRQAVPVDFITAAAPFAVQVSDGYQIVDVTRPRLSGDSVWGIVNGAEAAIPLRRVQRITTIRFSRARTVLLVGGVAATLGMFAYAMSSKPGSEMTQCQYGNPGFLSDLCDINR